MAKKKDMTEEELQNSVEKGFRGQSLDDRAYRTVFDVLQKQPDYKLPSNFADKVIVKIDLATQGSTAQEMTWLYLGLASFVFAAGIAMVMTNFKINFGALKFISGYPGLLLFGTLFILCLHWIDKKFIRHSA